MRARTPTLAEPSSTIIWQSPPIPEGGIVVSRGPGSGPEGKDPQLLPVLWSGRRGRGRAPTRRVLSGLRYSRFNAADDDYLDPVREMIADQKLIDARAERNAAGVAEAEQELQRLRAKREVQP
jgi:phosphonate transport system substrate-binding protein